MENGKMTICLAVVCAACLVNSAAAVEVDIFDNSHCYIELERPDSGIEQIWMTGSSTMSVLFAGAPGLTGDDDGDGLDNVDSQLTAFNFNGVSPTIGSISIGLSATVQTSGTIEENVNNTPGTLDAAPFTATGTCSSFFDIFVEVTMSGQMLHNGAAMHTTRTITHVPPGQGEVYLSTVPTPLLAGDGTPTGYTIKTLKYVPDPVSLVDVFNFSACQLRLGTPADGIQTVEMDGNSTMWVFLAGTAGQTSDHDGDGLDDADTQLTQWAFGGNNPALGQVQMDLSGFGPALGQMEEQANVIPNTLDIAPFAVTGTCSSFFDVFVEVHLSGQVLHSNTPIHLTETINYLPPITGHIWESGEVQVYLYDQDNNMTRYYITGLAYEPNAPHCGDAEHPYPTGDLSFDCRVNFKDIAIIALHWLDCTDVDCN